MKRLLVALFTFLACGEASAHQYWVMVDDFFPQTNQEITITIGYGHKFPVDEPASADQVEKLFIVEPDGTVRPLPIQAEGNEKLVVPVKTRLSKQGTHFIVVGRASWSTQTTRGYVHQPKDKLTGVLSSSWSECVGIAVVTVGNPTGRIPEKVFDNARFRLQPLVNLGNLHVGDTVPVKLFLDGKPFRSWIYATYEGFSSERDTYAYATRVPSADMTGKIKILKPGIWIITASDEIPYPDQTKAEVFSFACNVTFAVK